MNTKLHEEMSRIVATGATRTSYFQLNFFVLGKEPTIQGKLKKCADELRARHQSLENACLQIEESNDDIELLYLRIAKLSQNDKVTEIHKRKLERRILKLNKEIETIHKTIKAIEEESLFFVEAYRALSARELPKDWDDDEVQLEYWSNKYEKEIKERLLMHAPLDIEVIKHVLCLPDGAQVKDQLIQMFHKIELKKDGC